MKIKSVVSVHALAFGLGLACANGYGMNPMNNYYASPENNSANMPMEFVNIQQGSAGFNSNIDYDSLSKEDLLRMFLRLEEQNRQQTQMLMAQNEEYKRRIESLEATLGEQRSPNTVKLVSNQQTIAVAAARQERARKLEATLGEQRSPNTVKLVSNQQTIAIAAARQERARKAERDEINRKISWLLEERSRQSQYLNIGPGATVYVPNSQEYRERLKQHERKQKATIRISQIDAEISALNAQLASLR